MQGAARRGMQVAKKSLTTGLHSKDQGLAYEAKMD